MMKLKKLSKPAYNWLMGKDPRRWARCWFTARLKCDMLLNNLCETFNSWILTARDQPILTMMEMIRCNLMRRYQVKRQQIAEFQNVVCPKIQNKLNRAIHASRHYIPTYSGNFEFQVGETIKDRHVVNLRERTCSCRRWDLTGIPCMHDVACIHHNREKPEAYVHVYYHKQTYLKAYEPIIHPIKGSDMWPKCNQEPLLPPLVKKQPGRPRKVRRKDPEMEKDPNNPMQVVSRKGKTTTCTKCWGKGHNKRSCKNQPAVVPPNVYVDKRYAYPRPASSAREKRVRENGEVSKQNSRQGNKTFRTTSAIPTPCPNIQAAENSNMPSSSTNAWQGLYCNPHETSYVQVPHQPTITRVLGGTFTTIPRHSNSSRVTTSNSRVNIPQQKVGTSTRKFGTSTTTTRKKSSTTIASTSMFGLASATSSNPGQGSAPILRPPGMTSR